MTDRSYRYLPYLLHLLSLGKPYESVLTSTVKIAHATQSTQQTVSRKLREMEQSHLITRESNPRGLKISLTEKAYNELKTISSMLNERLTLDIRSMTGKVTAGLGEGGYYISLKRYKEQFQEHLGITPFPGTLNLEVDPIVLKQFIQDMTPKTINGFTSHGRTFGDIDAYPISAGQKNEIKGYLIIPKRTTHPKRITEIIARQNLRETLALKDGKTMTINRREE